jgi:benzoyl-CoA reductase/2-hydroxyglutaryl-CoA dehydratase subunit BcrC/BadD/HgdB
MELVDLSRIVTLGRENLPTIIEEKKNNVKVFGFYCTFSPVELAIAAGAYAVSLCSSKKGPLLAADNDLPQNLCPFVRTLYDLAMTDTCPYFHFSDMAIGETTCDGKKKVYELLGRTKPFHIMNLPQNPNTSSSLVLWRDEILRLKTEIENFMDISITDEALRQAIHLTNEEARARKKLFDLNRIIPAPITGKELLRITSTDYSAHRQEGIDAVNELADEIAFHLKQGYSHKETGPRILVTGCPMGEDDDKVIRIVEDNGGQVVVMENCGGYKTVDSIIDESDPRDPITLLAEKYLAIPCSVMSPNDRRIQLIGKLIDDFHIKGVIDFTLQACHTYNIESFRIADMVRNNKGISFLHLETNYSDADSENLRVRIEAFLETIS